MTDLDHLDALAAQATAGPTSAHDMAMAPLYKAYAFAGKMYALYYDRAEADYDAALRNAYPALAAELRQLRTEQARAQVVVGAAEAFKATIADSHLAFGDTDPGSLTVDDMARPEHVAILAAFERRDAAETALLEALAAWRAAKEEA